MAHSSASIHTSSEQTAAIGNLMMLGGLTSFCIFALTGVAIFLLRQSVINTSLRNTALVIGGAAAFAIGYSLYENVSSGRIMSLFTLLSAANLYYMYELYESHSLGFISDGTKTASSILIGINGLLAVLAIGSIFAAHDIAAAMR